LVVQFDSIDVHTVMTTRALRRVIKCVAVRDPDERRAVSEMTRVLRPGGLLLLADHIAAAAWPVRALQRAAEVVTVPLQGEHVLCRPLRQVQADGLQVQRRERFTLGLIERLTARKPAPDDRT
jgi:hypothetical protein